MEEQHHADDQSHYEISLTAGQAFIAFVLLLLSLAASFAFGLMIGRGQADERLIVRRDMPIVTEASLATPKKSEGKIVELPAEEEEQPAEEAATDTGATAVIEEAGAATTETVAEPPPTAAGGGTPPVQPAGTPALQIPHYAQLLSTSDQKTAEALAARVIERGFSSAYVERGSTDKGAVFRVRVRFPNEADARAAESKLREFSKEVWITAK